MFISHEKQTKDTFPFALNVTNNSRRDMELTDGYEQRRQNGQSTPNEVILEYNRSGSCAGKSLSYMSLLMT